MVLEQRPKKVRKQAICISKESEGTFGDKVFKRLCLESSGIAVWSKSGCGVVGNEIWQGTSSAGHVQAFTLSEEIQRKDPSSDVY